MEEKIRKTENIYFRLTPDEKALIEKKAAAANLSVSQYLIRSATKKKVVNHDHLLQLIKEINRIGTNINQAARIMNTYHPDDTSDIEFIQREFLQVKQIVIEYIEKEM